MNNIRCRRCNSDNVHKAGIAKSGEHRYQRYYCNKCYRISTYKIKEAEANPVKDLTPASEKHDTT
jgi:transposase-like protein